MNPQEQALLNGFYKNAAVGLDATCSILQKVHHPQLQTELQNQLQYYRKQKQTIRKQMLEQCAIPQEQGALAQFCANLSIQMHCFGGASSSEIAKLMLKGTNEGVIQLTQLLNQSTELSDSLKWQGKGIIRHEEQYMKRLKEYL